MVDVISTDHWWDAAAEGHYPFITMEGQKVYRWATTQISEKVAEAIQAAGLTPDDIDCFIPHQANARIVDAMCRRIHLPESVVISNDIAHMGNASAASIPIAMASMLDNNLVKSSDIALIMGFGAGLVYGGQVLVLP